MIERVVFWGKSSIFGFVRN